MRMEVMSSNGNHGGEGHLSGRSLISEGFGSNLLGSTFMMGVGSSCSLAGRELMTVQLPSSHVYSHDLCNVLTVAAVLTCLLARP
eukprot:scaffold64620_cov29-Tisochrysis_lutea.AAC.2